MLFNMNKWLVVLVIITTILLISLVVYISVLKQEDDNKSDEPEIPDWYYDYEKFIDSWTNGTVTYVFKDEGTLNIIVPEETWSGTWDLYNGYLLIIGDESSGSLYDYEFSNNDNNLNITTFNGSFTFEGKRF